MAALTSLRSVKREASTHTLLETLLLSDFGRLRPDRAREIVARFASQHEELRGEPNANLRHHVSEKQTTSPAEP